MLLTSDFFYIFYAKTAKTTKNNAIQHKMNINLSNSA